MIEPEWIDDPNERLLALMQRDAHHDAEALAAMRVVEYRDLVWRPYITGPVQSQQVSVFSTLSQRRSSHPRVGRPRRAQSWLQYRPLPSRISKGKAKKGLPH
jgi:hypothetical protein